MDFVLLFLGVSNSVSLLLMCCMGSDWRRGERCSLSWLTRHVKTVVTLSSSLLRYEYALSILTSVRNDSWPKRKSRRFVESNISLYATSFFYGGIGKCLSVIKTRPLTYWFRHKMEDSETNEINAESMRMPIPRRELGWFGFYRDNMRAREVEWRDFFVRPAVT